MSAPSKLQFVMDFASAEDPDYPVRELNTHSAQTRGWQTPRFCKYPLELQLQLERPAQIQQIQLLSHEYKIATKIEIFVGLPSATGDLGAPMMKRLGYLSLDSNERTTFQARELKSVHVDTPGHTVRFVVHRCHVNKLNIYNQVGVVALNILGEWLDGQRLAQAQVAFAATASARPPKARRPPLPEDDIVFENVDKVTALQLKELLAQKDAAVRGEDYDEAKRLKLMIDRMRDFGEKVYKLEAKKQAAVEGEDYDTAKKIKIEIDKLRAANNALPSDQMAASDIKSATRVKVDPNDVFNRVLSNKNGRASQSSSSSSKNTTPSPSSNEEEWQQEQRPKGGGGGDGSGPYLESFDDRPIVVKRPPTSEKEQKYELLDMAHHDRAKLKGMGGGGAGGPRKWDDVAVGPRSRAATGPAADDVPRSTPASPKSPKPVPKSPKSPSSKLPPRPDKFSEELPPPESQTATTLKDYMAVGSVVGDYILLCLLSKNWSLREAAVQRMEADLEDNALSGGGTAIFRALGKVLVRGLSDKVANVFHSSVSLLRALLAHSHLGPQRDVAAVAAELVPVLLEKTGDSNARMQAAAGECLLLLARTKEVGDLSALMGQLVKGVKSQAAWKPVLSRLSLLQSFVAKLGVQTPSKSGVPLDGLMSFVVDAFTSANGEVRAAAIALTANVYKLAGSAVEKYLRGVRPAIREALTAEFERGDGADTTMSDGEGGKPPARRTSIGRVSYTTRVRGAGYQESEEEENGRRQHRQPPRRDESDSDGGRRRAGKGGREAGPREGRRRRGDMGASEQVTSDEEGVSGRGAAARRGPPRQDRGEEAGPDWEDGNKPARAKLGRPAAEKAPRRGAGAQEVERFDMGSDDEIVGRPHDAGGKASIDRGRYGEMNGNGNASSRQKPSPKGARLTVEANGTNDDDGADGPTDTCQFCGEVNPAFLDGEALDFHFVERCPMLCSCQHCDQVIEISSLTEHRLTECENDGAYVKCPRCHEAVGTDEIDKHTRQRACKPAKRPEEASRCPLCHGNIAPGEVGWNEHLLKGQRCPSNPRTNRQNGR